MSGRELRYVRRSQRDFGAFPATVQAEMGFALLEAQRGGKHPDAKPLHGFHGASVVEIAESHSTGAYRLVYTTKFPDAIYVLHAFKKKSTRGTETSQVDTDLIRQRLKDVESLYAQRRSR